MLALYSQLAVYQFTTPKKQPQKAMTRSTVSLEFHFIADDFGRDEATNQAMIHSHQNGILSGVALMMGQSASAAAVCMAQENPHLDIGWHFHVVDSQPLTQSQWPWRTPAQAGFAIGFSSAARALVRREIAAQWQAFKASGLHCAFINAHHHMLIHPFIRRALLDHVRAEFSGWLRWGQPKFFSAPNRGYIVLDRLLQRPQASAMPCQISQSLWGIDRTFKMQSDEVSGQIQHLIDRGETGLHEFMFHPRHSNDMDTQCLLELAKILPRKHPDYFPPLSGSVIE